MFHNRFDISTIIHTFAPKIRLDYVVEFIFCYLGNQ